MRETSEANVLRLFSTPVIIHDVDNAEALNAELKSLILERQTTDPGIAKSTIGGWRSKANMHTWAMPQAQKLLNEAKRNIAEQTIHVNSDRTQDMKFGMKIWANINGPGNLNQLHCHPGALWSGVYYVDAGEDNHDEDVQGELVLQDPRFPMIKMAYPELRMRDSNGLPQESQWEIHPINGRMILFPSWLLHSVRPYAGKRERISVAFDIMVQ